MFNNSLERGPLFAEADENSRGGGGGGNQPPTPTQDPVTAPTPGPDIAKLLEQMGNNVSKSLSDMRKEMQEGLSATNTRLRLVIDDLVEGTTNSRPESAPAPPPPPIPAAPAAPAISAPSPTEDALKLATIATRRKLQDAEDAKRQLEAKIEELMRDNRQTKIESAINGAMAKLQWADGASELVARDMMQKADIDADGKVKIGGGDPSKFIADWQANNRWAQPAPVNAGSGNAPGTTRRADGGVDLGNYNPAKVDPNSEDFQRLIRQTKQQSGMTT